ncbi:methyl-accepting chemotaxis protein [Paenibacillus nanensis]|uniref:Methyl-accepting chemotaxis protein n=1 Tax=Paenibacillus nanensis TaxID=393251 RepID=A0A3A1UNZ1_9BACL|nr:methyl-accepting chemotaxis protein [Paenibacillus nanensis]RIX50277.1 methyl-accepting chemotaxis protein [Paenibacillus nanensis]
MNMKKVAFAILRPASRLLNALKYTQKFLVIGVIILASLSTFGFMVLSGDAAEIKDAKARKDGLAYIHEITGFMSSVQKHRAIANQVISGNEAAQEQLTAVQAEADAFLEAIELASAGYASRFCNPEDLEELNEQWTSIKKGVSTFTSPQNYETHVALIEDIMTFIRHASDESKVTLAVILERSYMVDNIVHNLPQLAEQLGKARALGVGAATRGSFAPSEKEQLFPQVGMIETAFESVNENMREAGLVGEDKSEPIRDDVYAMNLAVNKFLELLHTKMLSSEKDVTVSSSDYLAVSNGAIDSVYAVMDKQMIILTELFEAREKNLIQQIELYIAIFLATILLLTYLFIAFSHSVKKVVSSLAQAASTMAAGDLTVQVKLETRDELALVGESFNQMSQSMREMIRTTAQVSEEVASASGQLSAAAEGTVSMSAENATAVQQVATGMESQLKGAEETGRAMEEMSIGIQRIAEFASDVAENSAAAEQEARNGSSSIDHAIRQMNTIHEATEATSKMIHSLGEQSKRIENIIEVIGEIAQQTNLLSLNASIEAARAGEHGRGFAVVASEVKKLAEQSKKSAEEIAAITGNIRASIVDAIQAMDGGYREVKAGTSIIQDAGIVFERIAASIHQVAGQIQEISSSSEQISAGTEEVTAAMLNIVDISQVSSGKTQEMTAISEEQLATMEEISNSAADLNKLATQLKTIVDKFKLD